MNRLVDFFIGEPEEVGIMDKLVFFGFMAAPILIAAVSIYGAGR